MKKFLVKVKAVFVKIFQVISEGFVFITGKLESGASFIWKQIVRLYVFIKGVYFSDKFRVVRLALYYVLLVFVFVAFLLF